MVDHQQQFQAYKAEASRYQEQLQHAKNTAEAVDLLLLQAESLVKAIGIAPSQGEKANLRASFKTITDLATRIKAGEDWKPPVDRSPQNHVPDGAKPNGTRSNEGMRISSSTPAPAQSTPMRDASQASLSSNAADAAVHTATRVDFSRLRLNDSGGHGEPNGKLVVAGPAFASTTTAVNEGGMTNDSVLSTCKATAAVSSGKKRRLAAPISTRERSKKEEIILLRGSLINGFKCPPWNGNPSMSELTTTAVFTDAHDLALSPYQIKFFQGWVRADKALPPPSTNPSGSVTGAVMQASLPIDLVQDAATDCSVVASLCSAIAHDERGHHELLTHLIWPFDGDRKLPIISPNGKYIVRLYFNGSWRKVVIDDRLPLSPGRVLHVLDRQNPRLLYPALLEKAYLKLRGGYDFPGSNSCGDLLAFTGWIPEQIYLQETETVPDQLWNRVYNGFIYGYALVTVGTGKMSTRQERDLGLEGQHSYAVLDMKQIGEEKMLLLKNPWAEGRGWRGPRPLNAPIVNASRLSKEPNGIVELSKDHQYPTTFWIGLEQLMQHFESIYLNWNPGMFGHRQDIHFQWDLAGTEASGGNCIIQHPQFSLSTEGKDKVWLLLSRHFPDTVASNDELNTSKPGDSRIEAQRNASGELLEGYMSLLVCLGNGERLYMKDSYVERGAYVNTPQSLVKFQTKANENYTIVVDQEELPAREYGFTLSAFSDSPISLEPAAQKYTNWKVERNSWTKVTAGGNSTWPSYFDNPQYTLDVKKKASIVVILSSGKHRNPLHVKLALGYGKRVYRLKNRDIVADSGEYREACAFAENKEVQPGLYTIICSLFEPGKTGDYTLRVESTGGITLKPIPRDGAGLVPMKLAHACFSPTVNKIAAPINPRRLISTFVIARFVTARSPRAQDLGMVARSPLRLSIEQGRGPDRVFFVTSEGGEYSDAAIVRTENVDLDPSFLVNGDLWIVLERLSSPGGPIEEVYEVELFSDTPHPATVGVWREWV